MPLTPPRGARWLATRSWWDALRKAYARVQAFVAGRANA